MSHATPPLPEWLSRKIAQVNQYRTFQPAQLSAVKAWLRLQASAQAGGEWTTWVDVINSNPATATSGHKPDVGSSNGLPTAAFVVANTDTVAWPVSAQNNDANNFGFWFRIKPTTIPSNQYVASCDSGAGGASARKWLIQITTGGVLRVVVFTSTFVLASFDSASGVLVAGTSSDIGFTHDNSGSGNAGKLKVFANGAYLAGTYGGAATLGTSPTPTGNIIIGGDAVPPTGPVSAIFGPNIFSLNRHLTTAELVNLAAFERTL